MSNENIIGENGQEEKGSGEAKVVREKGLGYTLTVAREDLLKAANGLKEAGFDLLTFVAGIDMPDKIKLTYRVYSSKKKNRVAVIIKTEVPKSDPVVDSLTSIWSSANWHERETYDLLGVEFKGHPDLRRMFMPDDWIGHPLRKDYKDDRMVVFEDYRTDRSGSGE